MCVNVLYEDVAPSKVLEILYDKSYHFIYLDFPRYKSRPILFHDPDFAAKNYSKKDSRPNNSLDLEMMSWPEDNFRQNYAEYVIKILKDSIRVLTDDGILAVLSPDLEDSPFNYEVALRDLLPSVTSVKIKKSDSIMESQKSGSQTYHLYFCSKNQNFEFPVLMELIPKNRFKLKDDRGLFKKIPAIDNAMFNDERFCYEWNNITPPNRKCWKYPKDEMDKLYKENRAGIENGKPYIKFYRDEHPLPIVSDWEYTDRRDFVSDHIDIKSISRMFLMFVKEDSRLLCPFDWDGKFSYMADEIGVKWSSVTGSWTLRFGENSLFNFIPRNHYQVRSELDKNFSYFSYESTEQLKVAEEGTIYDAEKSTGQDQNVKDTEQILKAEIAEMSEVWEYVYGNEMQMSIDDLQQLLYQNHAWMMDNEHEENAQIKELKAQVNKLENENKELKDENKELNEELRKKDDEIRNLELFITEIQGAVGGCSEEEVIERIHELVTNESQLFSVENFIPEAQEWIEPNWDKLEAESQHFIPTGAALYNHFLNDPYADMAAPMIEYCKSLEEELFQKLFAEYIRNLHNRHVNISSEYPEAFGEGRRDTVFASFLSQCLEVYWNNPRMWKFEMGNMVYVLKKVINEHPTERIFCDFKDFLNRILIQDFFKANFFHSFRTVTQLRNDCAHPYLVNRDRAENGRILIQEKLRAVLQNYRNIDD